MCKTPDLIVDIFLKYRYVYDIDFFCVSFLLFVFHVCHTFLFVLCSLMVTCWERADLLALLCVMFSCVFVTFPCGVLGQVRYLIVLISDLCLLSYFNCRYLPKAQICVNQ